MKLYTTNKEITNIVHSTHITGIELLKTVSRIGGIVISQHWKFLNGLYLTILDRDIGFLDYWFGNIVDDKIYEEDPSKTL